MQYLLAMHVKLQVIATGKRILDWSPEQISGRLPEIVTSEESNNR